VLRAKATRVTPPKGAPVVDTCGTGGDHSGTFNISTTAAFVVAAGGAVVAKHGNHSNTSASGSADVLQALGVNLQAPREVVEACLAEIGIGFMYAPAHHPAMRHAGPTRKELGIRSIFNLIGPLSNPAGADHQVVGVYDRALVPVVLEALGALGLVGAMVVHGADGLDELSTCAETYVGEWRNGRAEYYTLDARELGLARATHDQLKGGEPAANAAIARAVLGGEEGPKADIVALNAAAALKVAGLAASWEDGLAQAHAAMRGGAALAKLDALGRRSHTGSKIPETSERIVG
jgi:anthranilate phosphoribosyltransferase